MNSAHKNNSINMLLKDISRCRNICGCFSSDNSDNPCCGLIESQNVSSIDDFQIPEPWSGFIETAPILFISDYQRLNREEEYPLYSWSDYHIENFFKNRFSGGQKVWVKDGLYPLLKSGQHSAVWNRFWSASKNRAIELYRRADAVPGIDFATTAAVKCPNINNKQDKSAEKECAQLYLQRLINLSGASVIVAFGDIVTNIICSIYGFRNDKKVTGPVAVNGVLRCFAFLPHHNAKGPRTFGETFALSDLDKLISFLDMNLGGVR